MLAALVESSSGGLQLISQVTSLGDRRKRGGERQAIGRSCGGRGTRIHLVVDGAGRVLAFTFTAGQAGDLRPAQDLLAPLTAPQRCAADTAYDSNTLRSFMIARGTISVIPNTPTRKNLQPFDPGAYRARNIIERDHRAHGGLAPRQYPIRQARRKLRLRSHAHRMDLMESGA